MKRRDVPSCIKSGPGRYSFGGNLSVMIRGGSALWEYQFRDGAAMRTIIIGPAIGPTALSITAARDARMDAVIARRSGVVLLGKRPQAVAGDVFSKAAETYLANHSDEWSPRHRKGLAGLIRLYAGPLNPLPVNKITTDNVADTLRPIWNGPGDNRGARLRRLVEAVLTSKHIAPNPATWDRLKECLSKAKAEVVQKKSMPYAEVPAFVATLGDGTEDRAMLFTILTGVRRKEALGAEWSEFDFVNRVWIVPASRMKMKIAHAVPLTDQMIAVIGTPGEGLVFPAPRSGAMFSNYACSMKEHGYTLHGMRASFSVWAEEQDDGRAYPQSVITAALAHGKGDKTKAAYLRSPLFDARRKLMENWSAYVTGKAGSRT